MFIFLVIIFWFEEISMQFPKISQHLPVKFSLFLCHFTSRHYSHSLFLDIFEEENNKGAKGGEKYYN